MFEAPFPPIRGSRIAVVPALFALSLLGACSTAGECNPNAVDNVFQSFGCNVGGGFDASLEEKRAELAAIIEETELTQAETAEIEAEADRYAEDRDAWQRKLQQMNGEIGRLQLEVLSTEASNAEEEATLQALREELEATQNRIEAAESEGANVDPEEIARLQTDVAARKQAISEILATIVAE